MSGTVLLTGAAGSIGTAMRQLLPDYGWTLRCFDRTAVDGGLVGDLGSTADLDEAMRGVDAVAHFAGMPTEAPWPVIRDANVDGLLNVFEAARRNGVRRIVWASSNHAVGFLPVAAPGDLPADLPDGLPADAPPRPDTLYGVSKAFGEALSRYYVDRYAMQVACLRIGTFRDRPPDARALGTWLSPGDCARLVDACLRSPALDYAIVWGVSANTRRTWSLDAGRVLGFEPQDDAERYAAELDRPDPDQSDRFLGGGYTSPGYGIDEVRARS